MRYLIDGDFTNLWVTNAVVPNLLGTRDQNNRRQISQNCKWGSEGKRDREYRDGLGMIQALYLLCTFFDYNVRLSWGIYNLDSSNIEFTAEFKFLRESNATSDLTGGRTQCYCKQRASVNTSKVSSLATTHPQLYGLIPTAHVWVSVRGPVTGDPYSSECIWWVECISYSKFSLFHFHLDEW